MGEDRHEPDACLVRRLLRGESEAFDELVGHHRDAAYRLALRWTGDRDRAEDAVQEIFLRCYERVHTFDGRSEFRIWFFRLATNLLSNLERKRRRRRETPLEQTVTDSVEPPDLRDFRPVLDAMNSLPARQRAAIRLKLLDGYSYAEIAELLACSRGAARVHVHKALKRLRKTLVARGLDHDDL